MINDERMMFAWLFTGRFPGARFYVHVCCRLSIVVDGSMAELLNSFLDIISQEYQGESLFI
jgi:hypothetical protein